MINYKQIIISLGIQKLFLLTSLVPFAWATPENLPTSSLANSTSLNFPVEKPSVSAQYYSSSSTTKMMGELEQLIHRVESTLVMVEAKKSVDNLQMGEAIAKIFGENGENKNLQASFASSTMGKNRFTSNTGTYQAIASAKQLLAEFPQLARRSPSSARRRWLNARYSLWKNYPTDHNFAQPEIRAIWLDRGTLVKARSKRDLIPLFDRMAKAGINTVFLETVNASYPIYPSRVAPEQNPMLKGWDPLQASIELAHERGMELHAWLWVFAAANQGHNKILGQPTNYLGPVLSRNPSWVLKDQSGRVFNRTPGFKKAFFDPANPQVRNYLYSLMGEIVTKYDVDGIQLDYIRYPFQDRKTRQHFGYTNVSRQRFKQAYGVDPRNIRRSSSLWQTWTGFKTKQVDSFVKEVSQKLKSKRPELILSTAVFPMERGQRLAVLQQHWEDWIFDQSVDIVVLMTYALDTGSFEDRVSSLNELAGKHSSFIIPGIRLLDVPAAVAFDKMQLIRNLPSGGYALFAAENFDNSLEMVFQRTQGKVTEETEPIPYRQPFETALERYRTLQKEWIFLLENDQIKIDRSYLQQWSGQADRIAKNLQTLAENPNAKDAARLQRDIASFRLRLTRFLYDHQQNNRWQVNAWMNRLLTLESILLYGHKSVANQQGLTKNNSVINQSNK